MYIIHPTWPKTDTSCLAVAVAPRLRTTLHHFAWIAQLISDEIPEGLLLWAAAT